METLAVVPLPEALAETPRAPDATRASERTQLAGLVDEDMDVPDGVWSLEPLQVQPGAVPILRLAVSPPPVNSLTTTDSNVTDDFDEDMRREFGMDSESGTTSDLISSRSSDSESAV